MYPTSPLGAGGLERFLFQPHVFPALEVYPPIRASRRAPPRCGRVVFPSKMVPRGLRRAQYGLQD
eukprot:6632419-Pyramimonas_sp.AAC.1